MRPILFLDVDGVLIPYGVTEAVPDSATVAMVGPDTDDEQLGRINPALGARLLALGCDLVWATGWEDEANEVIAPRVGLPELPVLSWTHTTMVSGWLHWKTATIVEHAQGRPFVWVDDELTGHDRDYVALAHGAPALLHRIDPHHGLTEADVDMIGAWLSSVD
jgi:hypothetical protein